MNGPLRRLALAALVLLGGCHRTEPDRAHSLIVAATPVPHAEILRSVRRTLAKQGVGLTVREVNDYETPNELVASGAADLNYVQTRPNLARYNRQHHADLVEIAPIHSEPLAAYSRRIRSLARLPNDATVGLPAEPSTIGRALLLLQRGGLIRLAPNVTPTLSTIADNPRRLKFVTAPPESAVALLDTADLVFVNTNFALAAKLDPSRDALLIEGSNSPYVNILVGKRAIVGDPRVAALVTALRSPAARTFMAKRYKGAVIPAP